MNVRREEGFTLVELLVAVVILGVVMSALAAAIIAGLKTTDETNVRLSESHDAQIASAWFVHDVQSAADVSLSDATCSDGNAVVVRFSWMETAVLGTTPQEKVVSYVLVDNGTERRLVRRFCQGGAFSSETVIAHHLKPAPIVPVVTCDATPGACPSKPTKVTIEIEEETGYSYSLTGTRRAA